MNALQVTIEASGKCMNVNITVASGHTGGKQGDFGSGFPSGSGHVHVKNAGSAYGKSVAFNEEEINELLTFRACLRF